MVRSRLLLACAVAALVALGVPALAYAANPYGQTFAGQEKCLSCHGQTTGRWQVGTYKDTAHGVFVTDVKADQSKLVPSATNTKMWPSASVGGGYAVTPADMWLQLGQPGGLHEYVQWYKNDTTHTIGTGLEVGPNPKAPADDFWFFDPINFDSAVGQWEIEGPAALKTYFQGCGGCHNLGVTRPSDTTYTLPTGATMSHDTSTTYAGLGIQCENCHGTGGTKDNHWTSGVGIVRTKRVLESQTCGQCHATLTSKQKNYVGNAFSQANGFTPDRDLRDFVDVYGASFVQTSPSVPAPVIPDNDKRLYPDGHNKSGNHFYYNEWSLTAHARSLRWPNGQLFSASAQDECLKCHSGEGFLKSIGYGSEGPNDVGIFPSKVASDTLDIECSVCHTVHAKTGDALGLRLPEDKLCVACHNGGTVAGKDAVPPSRAEWFPQKEMFEGYGLIGVRRPGEFMEDATCVDCHMTETRKGRVSHAMKPMMPGDAEAWNVPEEGDACTHCHAGLSRAKLQAKIDAWQSDVARYSLTASKALAAAKTRPAATTAAGKELIAAADTNIKFVAGDRSGGVHNYPYASAGLWKAAYYADAIGARFASFGVTSFDARAGFSMVYGKLVMGTGAVRKDEFVTIEALPGGTTTWVPVATVKTLESGDFYSPVVPKGTTKYRARWMPKSAATAVRTSEVALVFGSATTLKASVARLAYGSPVTLTGNVSPGHTSGKVNIEYASATGWRRLSTVSLSPQSAYSLTWSPTWRGTIKFRTTFASDGCHTGSTSAEVDVVVY